jgi:drug/metabolite transporter (DMT)-like permease
MSQASSSAYLWMFLSAFSFSVMSFLTHCLQHAFPWQTIAIVRTGVALLLVLLMARASNTQLVIWKPATLWIRSLAGSAALLANFFSLTHYPTPEVLALSTMFPLWVAILSWPVLRERPSISTWLAALIGIGGVFVLQQPQAERFSLLPVFTALGASLASAVALLGLHRLKTIHTTAVVAHFSAVSLLVSMAAVWIFPFTKIERQPHWWELALLCAVGISATAGQLLLTKAFAAGSPARVSVIGLSQVAFTMLFDILFLHRSFSVVSLVGFLLILGPTSWVLLSRNKE